MNGRHVVGAVAIAMRLASWPGGVDAASSPISSCPFLITGGGTYGLANDVTAIGDCITIAQPLGASVTVNLNGFTITGDGTGTAIVAPNPGRKISVVGPGTITHFDTGVDLFGTTDVTVKRLTVTDAFTGIAVGQGSITDSDVSSSVAFGNFGVLAGDKSTVTNVTASNSYFAGIEVGARSSVTQSTAENNILGISAGQKSRVKSSIANGNAVFGIGVDEGGSVTESTANGNGIGIFGDIGSNINKNTVNENGDGILIGCPGTVQQNTLTGNSLSDINLIGDGCTVKNNVIAP
jgi:hypothetical protein